MRLADLQFGRKDALSLEWQSDLIIDNTIGIERHAQKLIDKEFNRKNGEWFACTVAEAINACSKAIIEFKPKPKDGIERLCISLTPESLVSLTAVKNKIEKETGKKYSMAKIVRQAIDCLADSKGVS